MKTRGSIMVEETLLLLIAVALLSAFALTISGVVQGAVSKMLGFRNATDSLISSFIDGIKQLIFK